MQDVDMNQEVHNALQRSYYETRSRELNHRMVIKRTPYVLNHAQHVVDFAELKLTDKVLDMGCGMGKFTIPVREMGYDLDGFDLSDILLDDLRAATPENDHRQAICGDALNIDPSLYGQYDKIIGFFTLHHMLDLKRAFTEFRKVLKPGGRVTFVEPNPACPLFWLQITFTPSMSWAAEKGIFNLTRRKMRDVVAHAGLTNLRISHYGVLPPALRNRGTGAAIERTFDKIAPLRPVAAFRLISADLD